jgi:hypothetical protein
MPQAGILARQMSTSNFAIFFSQMLGQSPHLLVCVGGMILCTLFWRRAPTAAMLALIGLGVMLVSAVASAMLQNYLLQQRLASGQSAASFGQTMLWVGIGWSIIRSIALGLLVAAVFVGRPEVALSSGFEVQPYERAEQPPSLYR